MRGHRDLELVAGGSLLCALLALLLPFEAVRVVFAAPLTLFLPGYAISAATFARRPLGWPHLLLLSVALSLAVLALGSLLLNYMPGGVQEISWVLLLLLIVLNGCRVAALRRPREAESAPSWPRPRPSPGQAALLGGGALAALAALVLAMTPLPADEALGYTEMWISTDSSLKNAIARVGIRSEEKREVDYFMRVRFGRDKHIIRLLGLEPGEMRSIQVRADPSSRPIPVTASLFRQEQPAKIYRRVLTWVPAPVASR